MSPWIVVLIVVTIATLLLVASGPAIALQRNKRAAQRDAYDLTKGKPVVVEDRLVQCFGRRSVGSAPNRGSGTLLCTDEALIFVQWYPRTRMVIPRASICSVTAPSTFNGKDAGMPMLGVEFTDTSGANEAIAWLVRDRRAWAISLAKAPTSPS